MENTRTLKVLSYNIWAGTCYPELAQFFKAQENDFDVICLQEVYSAPLASEKTLQYDARADLMQGLQKEVLPEYEGYFFPFVSNIGILDECVGFPLSFGLATFVSRSLQVVDSGSTLIHGHPCNFRPGAGGTVPRYLAHVTVDTQSDKPLTIANYHGLWTPNNSDGTTNKGDSPDRLEQSKKVRNKFDRFPGNKILCGDLNIRPDTKSFAIMAQNLQSPLTAQKITNTRSNVHYKKVERYADYILAAHGVDIVRFGVLPAHDASDHLPLLLEILR